jgi:hypothetical protein
MRDRPSRALLVGHLTLVLCAAVFTSLPGEVVAKHRKHVTHHHWRARQTVEARVSPVPDSRFGAMRYGGLKSPMWRAPVDDQ